MVIIRFSNETASIYSIDICTFLERFIEGENINDEVSTSEGHNSTPTIYHWVNYQLSIMQRKKQQRKSVVKNF